MTQGVYDLAGIDGDTIVLSVERSERRQREQPDRTISAEALEAVVEGARTWTASRLMRFFKGKNRGAQKVEITLTVRLDDEPPNTLTLPARFSVIDGQLRMEAGR
jgi:hypothetical protein